MTIKKQMFHSRVEHRDFSSVDFFFLGRPIEQLSMQEERPDVRFWVRSRLSETCPIIAGNCDESWWLPEAHAPLQELRHMRFGFSQSNGLGMARPSLSCERGRMDPNKSGQIIRRDFVQRHGFVLSV